VIFYRTEVLRTSHIRFRFARIGLIGDRNRATFSGRIFGRTIAALDSPGQDRTFLEFSNILVQDGCAALTVPY
ncbi:unnamed protein product, partial [Acidithrix sp. C25]